MIYAIKKIFKCKDDCRYRPSAVGLIIEKHFDINVAYRHLICYNTYIYSCKCQYEVVHIK